MVTKAGSQTTGLGLIRGWLMLLSQVGDVEISSRRTGKIADAIYAPSTTKTRSA